MISVFWKQGMASSPFAAFVHERQGRPTMVERHAGGFTEALDLVDTRHRPEHGPRQQTPMTKSSLLPEGESLRNAIRWISARRLENPKAPAAKLIEEAALRFDLSPRDVEFLQASLSNAGDKREPTPD
jgi:hypothetical protein